MTRCPRCRRTGHVELTPDGLAREPWIAGGTIRCAACGHAWDGTDAEIVAALTDALERLLSEATK